MYILPKLALLFTLVAVVACEERHAPAASDEIENQLNGDIQTFYRNPSVSRFDRIVAGLATKEAEILAKTPNNKLTMAAFLAICRDRYGFNPMLVWKSEIVTEGVALNVKQLQAWLDDEAEASPGKLDVNWMAFFASGSTVYLDHIYACAARPTLPQVIDMAVHTAQWSYKANCKQDDVVLKHARSQLALAKETRQQDFLTDCIKYAEGR